MMVLSSYFIVCLFSGLAFGELRIGSCDSKWYYLEKTHCDSIFVTAMVSSSKPSTQCPDFYKEAHKCFEDKILAKCFEGDDEKAQKTIAFLDKEFGKENHFCEEGLLLSMKDAMKDIVQENCQDQTFSNYVTCEEPFTAVFKEEFDGPDANLTVLSKAYSAAKVCQSKVATSCRIPDNAETYHFFDVTELNPYDPATIERVDDTLIKIENGEGSSVPTATIVTVVIVVLVIAVTIGGVFYFLHRRDIARAEIRREKRESKKGAATATEMLPLSNDGNNPDEISPA